LAYGQKKGIRPIVEFSGVDIGLSAEGPKWLKKIFCKIFQIILEDILNINISGGCLIGEGMLEPISEGLQFDPVTGGLAENFLNSIGLGNLANILNEEFDIGIGDEIDLGNNGVNAGFAIYWKPIQANYANLQLYINIPLAPNVTLLIAINFRAGLKIVDMPSEVEVKKKGIGYSYLRDVTKMQELGLPLLNINAFKGLSKEEKLRYLTKQYSTKKRSEDEFFTPSAFHFQDVMANIEDLFNTDDSNPYPIYETEQLDLEPDEYYYEFGGYSGKFYVEHVNSEQEQERVILVPYQDFQIQVHKEYDNKSEQNIITGFTFTTPEGVKYAFDQKAYSKYDSYTLPS